MKALPIIAGPLSLLPLHLVEADKPNIIMILCDDLGYADVGFNGSKDINEYFRVH